MTSREAIRHINSPVLLRDRYGARTYILREVGLRKHEDSGEYYWRAELQDPAHGNCLVYVGLEDIEEAKQ